MLSTLCNLNLGEDAAFRRSYPNLIDDNHTKNLEDNKSLFKSFITETISVFKIVSESSLRFESLKKSFEVHVGGGQNSNNRLFDYVSVAISCLQLFAQVNWLGPVPTDLLNLPSLIQQQQQQHTSLDNFVFNLVEHFSLRSQEYEQFQDDVRDVLTIDGESVFSVIKCPHLLLFARLIFLDLHEHFKHIQQLLEERSATLSKLTASFLETMDKFFSDLANENDTIKNLSKNAILLASILYQLEAGHIQYQVYNWSAGQECFKRALTMSELNYEFIGLYGKRTKYQQKDLAQLFFKVNTVENSTRTRDQDEFFETLTYSNSDMDSKLLPKNVALNNEVLLEKIKISNKEDEEKLNLNRKITQLEQIIMFCCLFDFQKNNAQSELTLEELSPIIEYLLAHPQNWCVQVCTLFMRAKLEVKNAKRMERSLYQMENLWDCYRQPADQPSLKQRLPYFYAVLYPSFWTLQKELAKTYMQIGMINSSLEIYLSLKMWNDVIICYQALDKRDKAEEIIRQQLKIRETPDLYCSLGEATKDESHFHKAIELSKSRSARAYRLLAKFYFSKQQYEEAIVNFEKSLEINSMQYDAWFMLGSAAFRTEKWQTSIRAFRSCTHLDPENYQNWNNLAAAYIKLNQKDKAYNVLQEALKQDYENWKIWENFLWTSTDCGYFEDVIKAYHRLLDLKEKYVDIDVLKVLASATRSNMNDANQVPIRSYKQKLLELFGRLTSLVVTEWQVYWCYADVVLALAQQENQKPPLDAQSAEKYFGLVLKAFRNLQNQTNWDMSVEKCKEVITHSSEILKKCNEYGMCLSSPRDTLGSVVMSVKAIVAKLKLKYKVDEANSTSQHVKLLYLKDVNDEFVQLQSEFDEFNKKFFTS